MEYELSDNSRQRFSLDYHDSNADRMARGKTQGVKTVSLGRNASAVMQLHDVTAGICRYFF